MKSMLASFPFSNGLGTSLPLSRVKNLVIGSGRTSLRSKICSSTLNWLPRDHVRHVIVA